MKFNETDLTQLHEDLQTKKISAKELTKAAFDRIKETDDDVKAFITLNEDEALKRAESTMKESRQTSCWLGYHWQSRTTS